MSTIRKIGPKLFLCGIICGLLLIGWASRYSIAQGRTQEVPPQIPSGGEPKEAPPQAKPETVGAEPALALPGPVDLTPGDATPPPGPKNAPNSKPLSSSTSRAAPVVVGPDHSPIEAEDPEKLAGQFLDQNQRIAEAQVKSLKEEAEKLKTRLTKVEAGIKRWERLLVAFKQSQEAVDFTRVITPGVTGVVAEERPSGKIVPSKSETEPTDLSPVSPAPGATAPKANGVTEAVVPR